MYVYCSPQGGFNDQLTVIYHAINYCNTHNRTLLLDTTKSCYQINWSDYFTFQMTNITIISDIFKIKELLHDGLTVYPPCLTGKLSIMLNVKLFRGTENNYCYVSDKESVVLQLPKQSSEDVIIYCAWGSGRKGFDLFKTLILSNTVKTHCNNKFALLSKPYLGIQIRNTDYKCDYVGLYEENKDLIHSYKTIYIATDCKEAIDFFKTICINSTIFNFTTFPDKITSNLHTASRVNGDTKMKDLLCDIYMITMCDKFITNSKGGFVHLLKQCHNNDYVKSMFLAI